MARLIRQVVCIVVMSYLLWIPATIIVQAQQGNTPGQPWLGEPGVRESVREITSRRPSVVPGPPETLQVNRRGRSDRGNLPQNPDAPNISQWPTGRAPDNKRARAPTNLEGEISEELDADQAIGASFTGATYTESFNVPPSPMGDVGPNQILMVINGRVRTFTKGGALDGVLDTTSDDFFNSVRN